MIPVQYFFVLSALLFFIGVYGFCTRRNLVAAMLISIELVLNAADLNFAVFNRIPLPRTVGRFLLHIVLYRSSSSRDSRSARDYYQRLPQLSQ